MHRERIFEVSSILAAIAVPTFAVIANTEVLRANDILLRSIALAGTMFLVTALFTFLDLIQIRRLPGMKVADAFKEYFSSRGLLLIGLISLLVFQLNQSSLVFF